MEYEEIFEPVDSISNENFYLERTNRNIGWISQEEQFQIKNSIIGVAGCGGMGGLVASILVRLGVGEVRIADSEEFDISNINRQFAATAGTVGKSKALETARMLREIADDTRLLVYPTGINEMTVSDFIRDCDIIFDEIEFWAIGSRLLLHGEASRFNVPLITCSSVGFGSRLFYFDHKGMSIENMIGMKLSEAMELQAKIQNGSADVHEVQHAMSSILDALIPEVPTYSPLGHRYNDYETCVNRLLNEQRAPIIATNPAFAAGFAANFALVTMLSESRLIESVTAPPTPGYLHIDVANFIAERVCRTEIEHVKYL